MDCRTVIEYNLFHGIISEHAASTVESDGAVLRQAGHPRASRRKLCDGRRRISRLRDRQAVAGSGYLADGDARCSGAAHIPGCPANTVRDQFVAFRPTLIDERQRPVQQELGLF